MNRRGRWIEALRHFTKPDALGVAFVEMVERLHPPLNPRGTRLLMAKVLRVAADELEARALETLGDSHESSAPDPLN